jgi:archaellum component FlaF (FlaF/FlaG flagellin family)
VEGSGPSDTQLRGSYTSRKNAKLRISDENNSAFGSKGMKNKEKLQGAGPQSSFNKTSPGRAKHPQGRGSNKKRDLVDRGVKEALVEAQAIRDVNREIANENRAMSDIISSQMKTNLELQSEVNSLKQVKTDSDLHALNEAKEEVSRINVVWNGGVNPLFIVMCLGGLVCWALSFYVGYPFSVIFILLGLAEFVIGGFMFSKPIYSNYYRFIRYTGEKHYDLRTDEAKRVDLAHTDALYAEVETVQRGLYNNQPKILKVSMELFAQIATANNMRCDADPKTTWERLSTAARLNGSINISSFKALDEIQQNTAEVAMAIWSKTSKERMARLRGFL